MTPQTAILYYRARQALVYLHPNMFCFGEIFCCCQNIFYSERPFIWQAFFVRKVVSPNILVIIWSIIERTCVCCVQQRSGIQKVRSAILTHVRSIVNWIITGLGFYSDSPLFRKVIYPNSHVSDLVKQPFGAINLSLFSEYILSEEWPQPQCSYSSCTPKAFFLMVLLQSFLIFNSNRFCSELRMADIPKIGTLGLIGTKTFWSKNLSEKNLFGILTLLKKRLSGL